MILVNEKRSLSHREETVGVQSCSMRIQQTRSERSSNTLAPPEGVPSYINPNNSIIIVMLFGLIRIIVKQKPELSPC